MHDNKICWSEAVNGAQCFYNELMLGYIDLRLNKWHAVRSIDARRLETGLFEDKVAAMQFVEQILEVGVPRRI